ncbi:MAG: hypothetical protein QM651_02190 [Rhodoblastus sp.]
MTEKRETYGDWRAQNFVIEQATLGAPGQGWLALAKLFAIAAVLAWMYAEASWFFQTVDKVSVGIGTSGYGSLQFSRAIALAVLSAACAGVSIATRARADFRVHSRDIYETPED